MARTSGLLAFSLVPLESLSLMMSYCRQNRAMTAGGAERGGGVKTCETVRSLQTHLDGLTCPQQQHRSDDEQLSGLQVWSHTQTLHRWLVCGHSWIYILFIVSRSTQSVMKSDSQQNKTKQTKNPDSNFITSCSNFFKHPPSRGKPITYLLNFSCYLLVNSLCLLAKHLMNH